MNARHFRPFAELARATATGLAQMLFAEAPATGALVALGLAFVAGEAAAMSVGACVLATVTARALGYPAPEVQRGFYGYSGALVGLFLGLLYSPPAAVAAAVAAGAIISVPLTRMAYRYLMPKGLPVLALPALAIVWCAAPLLAPDPAPFAPSPTASVIGWVLILVALGLFSRLLVVAALLGTALGAMLDLLLQGTVTPLVVTNAMLTATALGAVFLPPSAGAALVAGVAGCVAGLLSWAVLPWAARWGLPVLVAPFTLVTLATLVALRSPPIARLVPGRPAPLPLTAISRPERARASWLAIRQLGELMAGARRISVLTGAGVSTAAGIPDFRGPTGLWTRTARISLQDFVTSASVRATYWREEEAFFRLARAAEPTLAHRALAELHRQGRLSAVVTQNVDGLHQAAGLPPEMVIELHGNLYEAYCLDCGERLPRAALSTTIAAGDGGLYCPRCRGLLKGGSVMFGETISAQALERALRAVVSSDLLLVLGTSLAVAPASDMLEWADEAGIPIAIVNASATPRDERATLVIHAEVGVVLSELLDHGHAAGAGYRLSSVRADDGLRAE